MARRRCYIQLQGSGNSMNFLSAAQKALGPVWMAHFPIAAQMSCASTRASDPPVYEAGRRILSHNPKW